MRDHDSDYFGKLRRDLVPILSRRNPRQFAGYGEYCWGITASDGPGSEKRWVNGVEREFYGYHARGAPYGPDDGTLSPWVVVGSLPFAPEIVIPTIGAMARLDLGATDRTASSRRQRYYTIETARRAVCHSYTSANDPGPVALHIANYRTVCSGTSCAGPICDRGLRRADPGGWSP